MTSKFLFEGTIVTRNSTADRSAEFFRDKIAIDVCDFRMAVDLLLKIAEARKGELRGVLMLGDVEVV